MIIVSGHQPLYLPWLGFIHKLSLADKFVFMDDVQLLDRDYNQRNRIMAPDGHVFWLSVPLARSRSNSLKLCDIRIANDGKNRGWQQSHLLSLRTCYGKTDYFREYLPFFEWLYMENEWEYLWALNFAILKQILVWFNLDTEIVIASKMNFQGKKSDLVLEHALRLHADIMVTGELGETYINKDDFRQHNITLVHQHYVHPVYTQGRLSNISHLSFVDLLFRFGKESVHMAFDGNITKKDLWNLHNLPKL